MTGFLGSTWLTAAGLDKAQRRELDLAIVHEFELLPRAADRRFVREHLLDDVSYIGLPSGHRCRHDATSDVGDEVEHGVGECLQRRRRRSAGLLRHLFGVLLTALAEQTRSVRLPLTQNSQLIRLARAETILAQVLKRDPTENEVSRLLEEPVERAELGRQGVPAERIVTLRR